MVFATPMLRAALALILISASAHAAGGNLDIVSEGTDINHAVNYSHFVFFDWNGDGREEVAGVDPVKSRLHLCSVDFPGIYIGGGTEIAAQLNPSAAVFSADTDADGKPDLILIDGTRVRVWRARPRTGLVATPPEIDRMLPYGVIETAYPPAVADFDRDGSPDLLLQADWVTQTPRVLFSFTAAQPVVVLFPKDVGAPRTGPPWVSGGPPTLVTGDGSIHGGQVKIYSIGAERAVILEEEIPHMGTVVELDGQAPPECYGLIFEESGELRQAVLKRDAAGWSEVASMGPLTLEQQFYPPMQAIFDADKDGRQELYFCQPGDRQPRVLRSTSTPAAATVVTLPEAPRPISGLCEVPVRSLNRSLLGFLGGSTPAYHYFSGFDLWSPGYGLQPSVRLSPLFTGYATDRNVPIKNTPGRIAVARLDRDPLPDLVVMGSDSLELEAHLGPLLPALNEYRPWSRDLWGADSLLLEDFTGDGVPDPLGTNGNGIVAVQTVNQEPAWPEIFFRKHSEITLPAGNPAVPRRVLGAADFDGDGDLDPLFLQPHDETLAWSRNSGTGTFSAPEVISVAGRTWIPSQNGAPGLYRWLTQDQVLATDADGDGDIDILTAPSALGNRLALHRNLGASGFSLEPFGPAAAFATAPSHLLEGRFLASDEDFQMLAIGPDTTGEVGSTGFTARILKSAGSGITALPRVPILEGSAVAVVDFDRDGLDDLISSGSSVTDLLGGYLSSTNLYFHRSHGDGTFAPPVKLGQTLGAACQVMVTDHNNDGLADLVVASQETGSIEVFEHQTTPGPPGYSAWAAGQALDNPDPEADGDHDGIANILAYAAGMNATGIATAPVRASIEPTPYQGVHARFSRPRLTDGSLVRVTLQSSPDLTAWTTLEEVPQIAVDPLHPRWEVLVWNLPEIPWGTLRIYFRFHVTWQPAP